MEISIDNYFRKRYSLFAWRSNTSLINKVIMAFFMACITGIMAQVVIPLPWTPVPITAQTFAVLMAGVVLGRRWGGISHVMYLAVGILGVPWFAGMTGGYRVILGASGGYFWVSFCCEFPGLLHRQIHSIPKLKTDDGMMLVANFTLIYIPGLLGLGLWIYMVKGSFPTLLTLITMGLLPFILGDLMKIGGAAALTKAITPKEKY